MLDYKIIRKPIRRVILRVNHKGEVVVSAPRNESKESINSFVESHTQWVQRQLDKVARENARFANGGAIYHFGIPYRLNISQGRAKIAFEMSQDSQIQNLNMQILNPNDTKMIKKNLFTFLAKNSQDTIEAIITKYQSAINREVSLIRFREMSSRWGSCNVRNAKITLNTRLLEKPKIFLEYVLLHELIHLIHANHGAGFYKMLESLMPNWREIKRELNAK